MKYLESIYTWTLKVASMVLLVLTPIHPVLLAVSFLIILDFVTGIWAAKKRNEKITSTNLKKTVVKTFLYQCSIIVAWLMETYLLDGIPVIKVVTGIIAVTEGKSFFENIHAITGTDFWSLAIEKIQAAAAKSPPPDEVIEVDLPKKRKPKRKKRKSKK